MLVRLAILVGVCFLPCLPVSATVQTRPYYVTDLGSPGGPSYAYGINGSGQVVGKFYTTSDTSGDYQAFLWDNVNGMTSLLGAGSYSVAYAINSTGQIAGSFYSGTYFFRDTAGEVIYGPTDGSPGCEGLAINNSGRTVGYIYSSDGATCYYLNFDGTNLTGHSFGGTSTITAAYAINNNGVIAGICSLSGDSNMYGFTYDGTTRTLLGLGGAYTAAYAINDSGAVVGSYTPTGNSATYRAFLANGSLTTDLGTLGGTGAEALAINANGQIVGDSNAADGSLHAFLYENGAMIDLNSLVSSTSGWTLATAAGINDSGAIVGTGINAAAEIHAFLLTPAMLGDADLNGTVNGADLNIVLSNYNQTGVDWAQGDFDLNGTVNGADLNIVLSNYNQTAGVSAAVPEPSALALLAFGAIGLLAWRGRGRR